MISYKLVVTQLDTLPAIGDKSNAVVRVHWAYVGKNEDGSSAAFGGSTEISFDADADFTPFENLTREQVAKWVLSAWSADETQARQDTIGEQLSISKPALPWPQDEAFNIRPPN